MTRATLAAALACICVALAASPGAVASQARPTGHASAFTGARPAAVADGRARAAHSGHPACRRLAGCPHRHRSAAAHTRARGGGSRASSHRRHPKSGRNGSRSSGGATSEEGNEEAGEEGTEGTETSGEAGGEEEEEQEEG
ncbi:MAG TPA: hypothetical protein VMU32_00925 [Solirubrobacteraceae bacterium]|nr:hypothetical protein [Solirubrobacteraceae bacterium]